MTEQFAIGERAIFVRNPYASLPSPGAAPYFDTIVEIVSAPLFGWDYVGGYGYTIRMHDGVTRDVGVVCLRKRPQAPDWVKLCQLGSIPTDVAYGFLTETADV